MKHLLIGCAALVAVVCLILALSVGNGLFAASISIPDNALRNTPYPVRYNAATDVTVGNLSGELTSVSLQSDTTLVCIWVTGENAIANWWSTSAADVGTTNGWYIVKTSAPAVFDGFVMSTTLWIASASATSSTATVLEFK